MNSKQYTFSDFTKKTVINVCDGRELGHVCDLVFNNCGNISAIIVPGKKSLFKSLTSSDNFVIPFNRIVKIGSDVILTDVVGIMASSCQTPQRPQPGYTMQTGQQAGYNGQPTPSPQGQGYAPLYPDSREYAAQAYSMPAEPMYVGDDPSSPSQPPPSSPDRPLDRSPQSAQTYYHAE